jgi:hypothetical protein
VVVVFRLLYLCAAILSSAAGALVIASLFIEDRAAQGTEMLGIHLAVSAVFMGGAGGALLCPVLAVMTYAILARLGQGFAVFG